LSDEGGGEFVGKKTDRYYVVGYEYLALAIKLFLIQILASD
jgi:hypothetical protein